MRLPNVSRSWNGSFGDKENKVMTEPTQLDIEAILRRLPHRFPFLLVDRVLSLSAGQSVVALKNVTINEAFFEGHFPQYRVMPGVLILEALAQAGGILAWESAQESEQGVEILYLAGIDAARFKRPVVPGDQLTLKAELKAKKRSVWKYACRAEVEGQLAAEAEITMVTRR
jgi:3-hydroxyacyl-[acyl-carrier-protein] dehydratase